MCQEFCPQGGGGSARDPLDRLGRHPPPGRQTLPLGRYPPGRHQSLAETPLGRHPLGQTPPSGRLPPGKTPPWPDIPSQQKATAVDGTHPTGMYSCFNVVAHCRKFHFTTLKRMRQCNALCLSFCLSTWGVHFLDLFKLVHLRNVSRPSSLPHNTWTTPFQFLLGHVRTCSFGVHCYCLQTKLLGGNVFTPVRLASGRYASYWNAFLFIISDIQKPNILFCLVQCNNLVQK